MLLFIVVFFRPYLFIYFHFVIDRNEIVANEQLNDGVDNCRSKASYCMLLFSILISFPRFDRRIHAVSLV